VGLDALFGPDIVTSNGAGTTSSTPSAVVLALFAFLTSWVVARYAFRQSK
jgi:ABC-type sulfate transport system permease component